MPSRSRARAWPQCWAAALALGCAVWLSACAMPERQAPGTPAAQVAQQLGAPHVRTALPEGGERWVYSRQPAGQQVFHLTFDAQQRLLQVQQVLEPAHFLRLQPQHDTQDTVYRYFGRPALVEGVASFKGDIWTYRISENNLDRLAHVFLDPQGVVQRVQFTDEPRSEPESRE